MPTVFVTPGHIPLDAFTQFAVHAKPNSDNPIGHFGTGLKYAVAIVLRHGGKFRMWVGETEYEFYTHSTKFRGKDIETIRLRKRHGLGRWRSIKLPFTVDLGKNWGLWQAYRELLTNTIDEGGQSYRTSNSGDIGPHPEKTIIEIECRGFDDAGKDIWLPEALKLDGENPDKPDIVCEHLDVWRRPSKYIYYKGVRVHELPIPSYFTYNFKEGVVLSEDRTIMNQYAMLEQIARWIDSMDFEALRNLFGDEENRWFEAHELSYYSVTNTGGSMQMVAETFGGSGGGYYIRALASAITPSDKKLFNLDMWFDRDVIYAFIMSWQNGDVEDTEFIRMFKNWVTDDEPVLLDYIRNRAVDHGDQLPFDLEA